MPLTKKIILSVVVTLILVGSSLGLILFLKSTSFSLDSWGVLDDEGFPGLYLSFSCSGTVTVKVIGPDSSILDSDFYFKGDHNTILHLAEYRHIVTPGQYDLKAYDNNDKEIFLKTFSFGALDLAILSCEQKWWERDPWVGGYSLLGLRMTVQNNGDTPVYPYNVTVVMDSEEINSRILPCVITSGDSEYVDCFIYRKTIPDDSTFTVSLEDIDKNTLAINSFSVDVENNVPVKKFSWQYNGHRQPNVPNSEYLYNYYSSLERIVDEDYGLYIFDPYDDQYIDILIDCIMFGFTSSNDVEKINYIASFVQNLEYKSDDDSNSSFEYPRYPIETLFNNGGGGDCEDKAILTASLLYGLGYDVALLRLPDHMAVGVHLSEDAIPDKEYYVENYYFLETTTPIKPCGFIPSQYTGSSSDVTVYPISSRALLTHNWEDNSLTIYTNTEMGDLVKVILYVENLGIETANNVKVIGGFYKISDLKVVSKSQTISSLDPGMKKKVTLSVNIPKSVVTWFKTRIYYNYEIVDERESSASFPT